MVVGPLPEYGDGHPVHNKARDSLVGPEQEDCPGKDTHMAIIPVTKDRMSQADSSHYSTDKYSK